MEPEIYFVREKSSTWNRMWGKITTHYGSVDCLCPDTGEVWQYMGSVMDLPGVVSHQFRHRSLKGKRVNIQFSEPFTEVSCDLGRI